jgi:hypothetical protein
MQTLYLSVVGGRLQRRVVGTLLDCGDGRVDLECLGDRNTTFGVEIVLAQAANEKVHKTQKIRIMSHPHAAARNCKLGYE